MSDNAHKQQTAALNPHKRIPMRVAFQFPILIEAAVSGFIVALTSADPANRYSQVWLQRLQRCADGWSLSKPQSPLTPSSRQFGHSARHLISSRCSFEATFSFSGVFIWLPPLVIDQNTSLIRETAQAKG
jgi:hypothetical protein